MPKLLKIQTLDTSAVFSLFIACVVVVLFLHIFISFMYIIIKMKTRGWPYVLVQ